MKKINQLILTNAIGNLKPFILCFFSLAFILTSSAQVINEGFEESAWLNFPAGSTSGQVVINATAATSTMSYVTTSGFVTVTSSLNTCPNSGTWWYSRAISCTVNPTTTKWDKVFSRSTSMKLSGSGYIVTPVTPAAVISVTFWASGPLLVGVSNNVGGGQPSYSSGNAIPTDFTYVSTQYGGASGSMSSYSLLISNSGPCRIGFFNSSGNSTYLDDIVVTPPTGTPPTVVTNSVTPGITAASVTGTVTHGTLPLLYSGTIWSTTPLTGTRTDTLLNTRTLNFPAATGSFTDLITGLSTSTTYYTESYVKGLDGSVYFGGIKTFTTNPPAPPVPGLTITQVLSNKASAIGTIIDSGGAVVSEKGFVYGLTANPTTSSNKGKFYEGSGSASFSDWIKNLAPNTTYHVRSYAINSYGTGYSKDTTITTGAPVPYLTAIPGTLAFGQNFYQGSPIILSYTLSGGDFTTTTGNITVTLPVGSPFSIATSAGGTYGNSITLPYTGSTLNPAPIYVKMSTSTYGTFSYYVTQSGGGVSAINADTVTLTGSVTQSPINVSNTGTDFWLGFGFEQKMQQKLGTYPPFSGTGANMYVNVSGTPGTVVTVEMPLLSTPWTTTQTIPASGVLTITGLPQGDPNDATNAAGLPDARLYYTGITNRGIHVYSQGSPISCWLYDYALNNSAGGSLVFPTNTWNSNYTVQAYGNTTNTGPPNSFFFVIAMQDNTPVYFTPSVDIIDSTTSATFSGTNTDVAGSIKYAANVTDTIYLNKGQVFNAMGAVNSAGFGLDLSGSVVRTDCDKKIAVFGGNGRCLVKTPVQCTGPSQGSDNMVQQMIPSVAWDTRYLTVPTKSMEHNLYRIYVHNATTQVWINDTTHTKAGSKLLNSGALITGTTFNGDYQYTAFNASLGGGGYYALETSYPMLVESDQPMSITQFITAGDCATTTLPNTTGNNGSGDPEMIILTGANQAINSATVYSPIIQDGNAGGAYINISIPTSGVSSFNLDNLVSVDTGASSFTAAAYASAALIPIAKAFQPYPANPAFSYAKFHVGNGTVGAVHTMSAAVPFNGIAYGVAGGESYGFNAGTNVKNLNAYQFADNPNGVDTSATAVRTCVNNPVRLRLALPYAPSTVDSVVWNPQGDSRISPNITITGPISGGLAVYDSTMTINGRTFYIYSSPVNYTFSQTGSYLFPVQVYGTFASDCPGESITNMMVIVGYDQDNLNFSANCGNPTVTLYSDTIAMAGTHIIKTLLNFGDGTAPLINGSIDTIQHTYPSSIIYTASLTTYNSVGCVTTDSIDVDFSGGLVANYNMSNNATCAGGSITFTDNSTATGVSGTPNKWVWNFGDGSANVTQSGSTSPVSHTFTQTGKILVTLTVSTTSNCVAVYTDTVFIQPTPVAGFTAIEACQSNITTFTDTSNVPGGLGTIDSTYWNFGDGTTLDSLYGTSIYHQYANPGTYTVKQYVQSNGGCTSPVTTGVVVVDSLPTAGFSIFVNCVTDLVTFTDTSHAHGGTIVKWQWNFGDGTDTTTTSSAPFNHYYANGNGNTYNVSLTVTTKNGCVNTSPVQSFGIGANPVASITEAPGTYCLPNATVGFENNTTISDGTTNQISYKWNFGDGTADSSVAAGPPAPLTQHIYSATGPYTVSLTAISNLGCMNTTSISVTNINPQPTAVITANNATCINNALSLSGNAASQWNWNFGDGTGTSAIQNPSYQWNAAGTYTVGLVITSAAGCKSDTAKKSVTVNPLPIAGFKTDVNCVTDLVTFTDTTTVNGNSLTKWYWTFGDGKDTTTTSATPFQHYYANGNGNTYTITLTVTNSNGCVSQPVSQSFTIGASPVASITEAPGTYCLPNSTVGFVNNSSISDGTTNQISYVWTFGDGTPDSSVVAGPPASLTQHVYTATGPYTVKLKAISNLGCTNTTSITVSNINPQPVAVITANSATCLTNSLNLNGNTAAQWNWNFGDGTGTSTQQNPQYQWSSPGNYTISLIITSAAGCNSAAATQSVTVNGLPVANFTTQATGLCANSAISFTDASTTPANSTLNSWNWNFGDGGTSTSQNPNHTYSNAGTYTVTLVVTNNNGCTSSSYSTTVTINPLPVPNFNVSKICIPDGTAQFTDASTIASGSITGWSWNFGDNSALGSGAPTTHVYATGGPYQVILVTTSNAGCTAQVQQTVTAYNVPTALGSIVNPDSLCSNEPVTLINESYLTGYGSLSEIQIFWNYANQNTTPDITDNSPVANKSYLNNYPSLGSDANYEIHLNAFSGNGCPGTSYDTIITVHGSPDASFPPLAAVCQNTEPFNLTGGSDLNNLPGTGVYSGAGITASPLFSPELAGTGTHSIRFTYTSTNGCESDSIQTINVVAIPQVDYGGTQYVLEGDSMQLAPVSVSDTGFSFLWTPTLYLNSDTSESPICKPANDITYSIQITTSGVSCSAAATLFVKVLKDFVVPNTFTPNGDGINDTWIIEELPYYPIQWVQVFDRYGQLVYKDRHPYHPWDGTFEGKPLPAGTYYYIIELDGLRTPKTGYVTILK